ncbi:unnamed protein product, partial [marine sediment metagenome]
IVVNLLGRGTLGGPPISLEIARKASAMGCAEPTLAGMESGYCTSVYIPILPGVLISVLTNGRRGWLEGITAPKTGDPRNFKSFEELREAFRKQLVWGFEMETIATNIGERLLAEFDPTLYQSSLIEDCIKKGLCREEGGARFNFGPFVSCVGVTDVGVEELIFGSVPSKAELYERLNNEILSAFI